ncbi:helix-turn-helix transcriptional regulator [Magnetospirillum aberrantis]|uniref:Helix-turn-helix transcriptional regulator n=1 Tax=Magnetospirillum aberrantis SpK TaxID=908842 RepID=A0A7C9UX79_9PROT|nr:AraC family transcriptional regulator [Magnetospirillum aberrantis]NFV80890.1 helix-turn-helix transcriptional regulator [Magnetospirillum aberrantis SpK]
MANAYRKIKFTWPEGANDLQIDPLSDDSDSDLLHASTPECDIFFTKIDMSFGISIFRSVHTFKKHSDDGLIEIGKVTSDLSGGSLMVQSVDKGRILHDEMHPNTALEYKCGYDLFRFADRAEMIPSVSQAEDCTMTSLTISHSTLISLLGADCVERMLSALGLLPSPKVLVHPMPASVSRHLHELIPTGMTGPLRRLVCQARALEYLSALLTHLGCAENGEENSPSRRRARKVFDMLSQVPGKLPSLDEIAAEFNVSARTLNAEFKAAYGQPIHTLMTDLRLNEAHAAIKASTIPLKTLAQQLGYTHTHHFLTAFRRKFGYPPSALRKK